MKLLPQPHWLACRQGKLTPNTLVFHFHSIRSWEWNQQFASLCFLMFSLCQGTLVDPSHGTLDNLSLTNRPWEGSGGSGISHYKKTQETFLPQEYIACTAGDYCLMSPCTMAVALSFLLGFVWDAELALPDSTPNTILYPRCKCPLPNVEVTSRVFEISFCLMVLELFFERIWDCLSVTYVNGQLKNWVRLLSGQF